MLHVNLTLITNVDLGYKQWRLERLGGGGGPKRPPLQISAVDQRDHRKNLHNGSVLCKLQDLIFRFSKIVFFYFILINYANLCEKSDILL